MGDEEGDCGVSCLDEWVKGEGWERGGFCCGVGIATGDVDVDVDVDVDGKRVVLSLSVFSGVKGKEEGEGG